MDIMAATVYQLLISQHQLTNKSTVTIKPTIWTKLTAADHWRIALVPGSSPPVVVGGQASIQQGGATTADIKIFDNSNKSWKKIGSLSSARFMVAI